MRSYYYYAIKLNEILGMQEAINEARDVEMVMKERICQSFNDFGCELNVLIGNFSVVWWNNLRMMRLRSSFGLEEFCWIFRDQLRCSWWVVHLCSIFIKECRVWSCEKDFFLIKKLHFWNLKTTSKNISKFNNFPLQSPTINHQNYKNSKQKFQNHKLAIKYKN